LARIVVELPFATLGTEVVRVAVVLAAAGGLGRVRVERLRVRLLRLVPFPALTDLGISTIG
jgi:hypothetical protein